MPEGDTIHHAARRIRPLGEALPCQRTIAGTSDLRRCEGCCAAGIGRCITSWRAGCRR